MSSLPNVVARRGRQTLRRIAVRAGDAGVLAQVMPTVRMAMVETFDRQRIVGWVATPPGAPAPRVSLRVNGVEIAATTAAETVERHVPVSEVREFRFLLWEVWNWIGPKDRIEVMIGRRRIPIVGHGLLAHPTSGKHRFAKLKRKLDQGWVFSRVGRLQLSKKLDVEWQRRITTVAAATREFMLDRFGYDAFYTYGSLLGAIREGGFIGHDVDLDMGYISRHTHGPDVGRELHEIGLAFIEAGFAIEPFITHLHVRQEIDGVPTQVDLFSHFFDENDQLAFPYGMAGTTHVTRSEWGEVHEIDFASVRAPVPQPAEAVLEQLYGANWRLPQPGFSWRLDRTERVKAGWMSESLREGLYWSDHYNHHAYTEPSTFFELLQQRDDLPGTVLDLGCGDGRDSIAFAAAGRRVVGLDFSHVGIRHAEERAKQEGVEDHTTFVQGDLVFPEVLQEATDLARAAADGGPVLFYLRFLLHSVPRSQPSKLLARLAESMRPGDVLALEFRHADDADLPKVNPSPVIQRRFPDAAAVSQQVHDELGLTVDLEVEGTGLAPWRTEDPHLYRAIAVKG